MLEERTAGTNVSGPGGKRFAPLAPLFAVKLCERGLGFELLFLFATVENFEKELGYGIG